MTVVVDTNVWVSLLFFRGRLDTLFHRLVLLEANLWVSTAILEELNDVCGRKFQLPDVVTEEKLRLVRVLANTHSLHGPAVDVCRDPDDNHVLQLCRETQADYLLTGDKDLLVMGAFELTAILSPSELADILKN